MILDSQLVLSWRQAVTASAASVADATVQPNSQGIIDLTKARNIGVGTDKLYLVVDCTTAMAAALAATVTPTLRTSATQVASALTGTINTLVTLNTFAAASPAGTRIITVLPPAAYLQYLDVYYTVVNGPLTAGAFSAYVVTDIALQTYYAEGFNPN